MLCLFCFVLCVLYSVMLIWNVIIMCMQVTVCVLYRMRSICKWLTTSRSVKAIRPDPLL